MLDEPVTGNEFFDRREIIEKLLKKFEQAKLGRKRNTGLVGLRKVGKTSILWEFMDRTKYHPMIYFYVKKSPTKTLFRKLLGLILLKYMKRPETLLVTDANLKKLSMDCLEMNPKIAKIAMEIRTGINRNSEPEALLTAILGLAAEMSKEKMLILIFDEFLIPFHQP